MLDRRGQIAETMTWLVATIVIIVILVISIFAASFYAGKKGKIYETKIADTLAKKSFFAYLSTQNVYAQLQAEGNLNEVNGNLGKKIFDFYKEEYLYKIWVGFLNHEDDDPKGILVNPGIENSFFGKKPSNVRLGASYGPAVSVNYVLEKIKLNQDKEVELVLMKQ